MNWLVSLLVGASVGILYGLLGVRSPAPPVIALVGLLGMLGGEQLATLARQHFLPAPTAIARPASPPVRSP
jgi:XapX domain-containing protein